jgi:hypothetical protein
MAIGESRLRLIASGGLVTGAVLGMAGAFASSAGLRALAWGIDGTALVVAGALLALHHFRRGNDLAAAGFLVFAVGEAVILSGVAATFDAGAASFAAGVALWSASLALVSASGAMPRLINAFSAIAALLFAVVAVRLFTGAALTPLSKPLPFFAYPFFAATLLGWAWSHYRGSPDS